MLHNKLVIDFTQGIIKYYSIEAIARHSKDISIENIDKITYERDVSKLDYTMKKASKYLVFHSFNKKEFLKVHWFTKNQIKKIMVVIKQKYPLIKME